MLFIKRRNFLFKQSESILYEQNVLKESKDRKKNSSSQHPRKWEIYFVFCVTEHCVIWFVLFQKLPYVHRFCKRSLFTKRFLKKALAQSTKDILSDTTILFKSSQPEMFYKKTVLKSFAILSEKHLCCSLLLIQLQAFRPATLGLQLY